MASAGLVLEVAQRQPLEREGSTKLGEIDAGLQDSFDMTDDDDF